MVRLHVYVRVGWVLFDSIFGMVWVGLVILGFISWFGAGHIILSGSFSQFSRFHPINKFAHDPQPVCALAEVYAYTIRTTFSH